VEQEQTKGKAEDQEGGGDKINGGNEHPTGILLLNESGQQQETQKAKTKNGRKRGVSQWVGTIGSGEKGTRSKGKGVMRAALKAREKGNKMEKNRKGTPEITTKSSSGRSSLARGFLPQNEQVRGTLWEESRMRAESDG